MATIQRPVKEGSVRTYQLKVGLGFVDILASEMDADLDTIYAAWNAGVDTVNIGAGSVTYAKLAPDAQLWADSGTALTPGTNFVAREVYIPTSAPGLALRWGSPTGKGRLIHHSAGPASYWTENTYFNAGGTAWLSDDATKTSWVAALDASNDQFLLLRAAAGSPNTQAAMVKLDNTGTLNISPPSTGSAVCAVQGFGASGIFRGYGANGTLGAATALLQYGLPAKLSAYGCYQANAYSEQGTLYFYAQENWSATARGLNAAIDVTPVGSTSMTANFRFFSDGSFSITGPTGTKSTGTTWANPSDIRLKKNVTPYTAGLTEVLALHPVQFEHNGFADTTDGAKCWGYLADDVAAVLPECVSKHTKKLANNDEVELDMLDTSNISLAVVNAIQELAARVAALEGKASA